MEKGWHPEERIFFLPREDNWWGPAGETGPCGPDTEMFVDTGAPACGPDCKPGCHCGKYFEIWNDVFMQYNKKADGSYELLARPCVDTGMGLERTVAMLQGKKSVYEIEAFTPILKVLESITGKTYGVSSSDAEIDRSFRIIADHIRAAAFILGDPKAVLPSNIGAGYVLRRLIRRAVRHGKKLGIEGLFLSRPAQAVIDIYKEPYPELLENAGRIFEELEREEKNFSRLSRKGNTNSRKSCQIF